MLLLDSHSYSLFRFDRLTGKGGGVAIFAKSSFRPIRIFSNLSCEYVALKFNSEQLFLLSCVYRPPSCDHSCHREICKLFENTSKKNTIRIKFQVTK